MKYNFMSWASSSHPKQKNYPTLVRHTVHPDKTLEIDQVFTYKLEQAVCDGHVTLIIYFQ